MRRIFGSRPRKSSITSNEENRQKPRSASDVTILHSTSSSPQSPIIDLEVLRSNPFEPASDNEHADSLLLSDTETLLNESRNQIELQESYNDNFTDYLPFLVQRNFGRSNDSRRGDLNRRSQPQLQLKDDDDTSTVFELSTSDDPLLDQTFIMGRNTSRYTTKRKMLLVSEIFKSQLVFLSEESFNLFKQLKANQKKLKKNQLIIHDNGSIKRIDNIDRNKIDGSLYQGNCQIDDRDHIIPIDFKIKGLGLPLFKIQVPYLSTFRKNAPSIVFKRYREIPLQPSSQDNGESDEFESYVFCTIHTKHFQQIRRLVFTFNPESENPIKVILFMSNFRAFSDFVYNGTRFRVLGSPIITGFINAEIPIRLIVIDSDKPSLCDDMINKKSSSLVNVIKKKSSSQQNQELGYDPLDYTTFPNPHPNPTNTIMMEESYPQRIVSSRYSNQSLPPFGYLDSGREAAGFLPRKYSATAKLQLYQDSQTLQGDLNSTLSADFDTMVLSCIIATIRETVIRAASKSPHSTSNFSKLSLGVGPLGIGLSGYGSTGVML